MSEGEKEDNNSNQNQEKSEKVNEKYDPYKEYKDYKCEDAEKYQNGPIGDESRSCTDCICCLIFIAFVVGCVVVAALGFKEGHPEKILYSYDDEGKQCGGDDYKDYPYLYFYDVIDDVKSLGQSGQSIHAFCVKSCPNEEADSATKADMNLDCKPTTSSDDCKVKYINYYRSSGLINRFCIPDLSEKEKEFDSTTQSKIEFYDPDSGEKLTKIVDNSDVIEDPPSSGKKYVALDAINGDGDPEEASNRLINWSFFSVDKLATWMADLYVTWPAILASVAVAFILSMLFLLLVRCCAGFIVYTIILLILACFVLLSLIFWKKSDDYEKLGDDTYKKTMLALMWVCAGLALVWFVVICLMCNRIRLAVNLIECTGKYIHNNCSIVFIPFLFFIVNMIWIAYWVVLSIYLYATGDFDENSKVIASFVWTKKIRYAWWFHLFALFYVDAIISAVSQFVFASSACIWYFTNEKGTEDHPICKSFKRAFRYHFGSLAFGSILIAIVKFLMFFLESFKKKVEQTFGAKSQTGCCYKCVIGCLQCCLKCIQKTLEFINKHAYIEIALRGKNFCKAAWEGFALMVKNLGRFSSLILLGSIFSFIGTLFIALATTVAGYFMITKLDYFADKLNSVVLPCACMFIVGFIMGMVSMSVFGMSSDALMHAFLFDEELNNGKTSAIPELQKFMSEER